MKKLLIISLLLVLGISVMSQTKLRSYSTSYCIFDETTQKFGEWTAENPSTILVVLDEMKITIYSKTTQNLSVITVGDNVKDDNGVSFEMKCVDANAVRCNVTLYTREEGYYCVIVQYSNVMFAYNCKIES